MSLAGEMSVAPAIGPAVPTEVTTLAAQSGIEPTSSSPAALSALIATERLTGMTCFAFTRSTPTEEDLRKPVPMEP
ncbi:MAG: hypothetical protein ABI364_00360 [Caldimonas sp.]